MRFLLGPLLLTACLTTALLAAQPVRPQHLETLSAAEAKALVAACDGKGYLNFDTLQSLSAEAAAELARHGGHLFFTSLKTLPADAAEALTPFSGSLTLQAVDDLSDAAAASLGRSRATGIFLPRLVTLSPLAQERLGGFSGTLVAPQLRTLLSGRLAERLAHPKTFPEGMVELSADAARGLATLRCDIHLDKLETISAEAAAFLADRPEGGLTFRSMRSLSPEVARALARTPGSLGLEGLESISPEVAAILAPRAGGLSLGRLREVPHPALMDRLVKRNGLRGVRTLPDEVVARIAAISGDRTLDGLTHLSDTQADILGRHEGTLSLNGVTGLSDEAARSLLRHRGPVHMAGLRDISTDTLAVFMQHEHFGPRWTQSLRSLTPRLARGLVASPNWDGELSGVVGFDAPDSVEIATILAGRRGPLRLANLKRISPRTLSALLDAEDLEIPLIQTLELIPEPDGSPTDDFVLPKGFEERQNRRVR